MRRIKTIIWWLMLVLGVALCATAPRNASTVAADAMPTTGMVCTTNPSSTFTLTTKSDYISLPDGNLVFMWSFTEGNNAFQFPGPVLCVNEGDTVTVVLNNTLNVPVSIMFPGQVDVLANNAPVQPQFSGANVTSLVNPAPAGGSVTYRFVAQNPGTYLLPSAIPSYGSQSVIHLSSACGCQSEWRYKYWHLVHHQWKCRKHD
ncbi:MAG: multicopper oxidase domain-containing protein [Herpetosiphon sp.]|nr:multicopper oxidase domain-containing protein [Herpetosiphon sp.]